MKHFRSICKQAVKELASAGEYRSRKQSAKEDKTMRENIKEAGVDKTIRDSFPASDPPSWY